MSSSQKLWRSILAIGGGLFFFSQKGLAQALYTEPAGNNFSGGAETDLNSVLVSNGASNVNFLITLNPSANVITNNYVLYEFGFQTNGGADGQTLVAGSYGTATTDVNPYGQQVGISTGETYWAGSYLGGSGYSGESVLYSFDQTNGWTYDNFSDLTESNNTISLSLPYSSLGLAPGGTFNFDLYSTFGSPGSQSAYDALDAASNLNTIPNYSPYSNANVAGSPTPYDSATEPGSLFSTTAYTIAQGSAWSSPGSGNWSDGTNWTNGSPNGAGVGVDLSGSITGASNLTLDVSITVGSINFNNSNNYTISGPSVLTLQSAGGNGRGLATSQIIVQTGTQQISAAMNLASNTYVTVFSGASLAITGPIAGIGGLTLTTSSSLTLSGSNTYTGGTTNNGSLTLAGGILPGPVTNNSTITVTANSATGTLGGGGNLVIGGSSPATLALTGAAASSVGTLTVNAGSSLDLTTSTLIVNYGTNSDPISTIVSYLTDGYAGGWSTGEITSSAVATSNATQSRLIYSVGYADGADGVVTGLSSGQIEIMPTLAGDAKLAGNVVFGDFQLLAANFGLSAGWDGGNFTYGSVVNFGDFQLLAQNFGASASGLTAGEVASLNSFAAQFGEQLQANSDGVGFDLVSVPEPASAGLLVAAAATVLTRRRRTSATLRQDSEPRC